MDIVFTNAFDGKNIELPKPAAQMIPDWYKNAESYINKTKQPNGSGTTEATVKRCMPVFDSMTAGYLITLPADVFVSIKDGKQLFQWADYNLVSFHPVEQAPSHPAHNGHAYPKFMNPWGIRTPKGYSSLFVQPFHREAVFTILPGIVDTDEYFAPVNFPFVINDLSFEGLIPVGTPIAQVIPFKRESWKMKFGTEKDLKELRENERKTQSRFFDRYKTFFRSHKEYK